MTYFDRKIQGFVGMPDASDSTAWWRIHQPFNNLERDDIGFQTRRFDFLTEPFRAHDLDRSDFVLAQRMFNGQHAQLFHIANTCMKPRWVDYDDNIWDVPRVNPAAEYYDKQARDIARIGCQDASVVTVTTPYLANFIESDVAPDANIEIVPNALPDEYTWNDLPREKTIIYRGGKTHVADLMSVSMDLEDVMRRYPDWVFVVVGEDPWFLTFPKNATRKPKMPIPEFHRWLYSCRASIMVVPLVDCPFNRSKSNISWIEGSYAGAAVLAPNFEEFDRPGCSTYDPNKGNFAERLVDLIEAGEERDKLVRASRGFIDENLRMTTVNDARAQIIEGLL